MANVSIYDFATWIRRHLANAEAASASRMIRAYAQSLTAINQRLASLAAQIETAKLAGTDISPAWLFQQERYALLMQQVATEMDTLVKGAGATVTAAEQQAVDLAIQSAPQMIASAHAANGDDVPVQNFARLPSVAVRNLVGFLANGSPLDTLLTKHGQATADAIKRVLITGVATGQGADVVARGIHQALGQNLSRALTISRTEIHRVHRETTRDLYRQNSDVVRGWRWFASLDGHSCAACVALHGSFHTLNERMHGHPNCRCTAVPALYDESEADFQTGPQWFDEQSDAMRERIVGKGGATKIADGDLTIEDFAAFHADSHWGGMWRAASLDEAALNHASAKPVVVFTVKPLPEPPIKAPSAPVPYTPPKIPGQTQPPPEVKQIARTIAKAHKDAVGDFLGSLDAVVEAKQAAAQMKAALVNPAPMRQASVANNAAPAFNFLSFLDDFIPDDLAAQQPPAPPTKVKKPPGPKANATKAVKLQAKVDAAKAAYQQAASTGNQAAVSKAFKALDKAMNALDVHLAATGTPPPLAGQPVVPQPSAAVNRGMDAMPFDLATARIDPVKQISQGMHRKTVYTDASGGDWLFKPQERFRADVDKATAALMRMAGLDAPETAVVTINGSVGSIQKMYAGVRDAFKGTFDPTQLDAKDIAELQKQAVFDWLVGNNDGHKDNFVKVSGTGGKIYGIDKGQAFKFYGKDRLDYDYRPNPVDTVYNAMHRAYAEGRAVPLDIVDMHGGGAIRDFIVRLQAVDNQTIIDLLTPYAESAARAGFLNTYAPTPNDTAAFLKAVLDRKESLLADWSRYHAELEAKRNAALGIVPATPVPPPSGVKGMAGATEHTTNQAGTAWGVSRWGDLKSNPHLTSAQRDALTQYTGSYYQAVNATLRSGAKPSASMQRVIDNMDAAMRKLPVPEDVILWRGTGADGLGITGKVYGAQLGARLKSLIGTIQSNKGYMSTSVGTSPAFRDFPVWLRVRANTGARGTYIAGISKHPSERELLLGRDTEYYIHAVRWDTGLGKWIVDVEVLPEGVTP